MNEGQEPAQPLEYRHGWIIPPEWDLYRRFGSTSGSLLMRIEGNTVEHFDESEVREIEIDDRNYPELLKRIKKPPKTLRIRGNLPPNRKIIAISGSRETTQQALDAAYRIGKMHAQHGYTVVNGLARGCDTSATEGALSAGGNVIGVVPRGLKSLQGHTKNLLKKSSLPEGQSFLNTLTTFQKYSVGTIYDAMKLSLDFPKKRSLSQLKSDRDRLLPQTAL